MVSKAFTEGFYIKPRIDLELLRAHAKGLIAVSYTHLDVYKRQIF